MSFAAQVISVVRKDLLVELRKPAGLGAAVVFAFAASVLVGFASSRILLDPLPVLVSGVTMVELFASIFAASMSFVKEAERGTLDGLRLSPIDPHAVFLAKLLFTAAVVELLALISSISAVFFGGLSPLVSVLEVMPLVSSLGVYLASVSALASAIAVYIEARGTLLPAMVLALSLPAIQSAAAAGLAGGPGPLVLALSGLAFASVASWLVGRLLEA